MITGDRKKQIQFWLGMAISAACLVAIFVIVDPQAILAALRDAHFGYVALSAVGIVLFLLLRAVRWRFILDNEVNWNRVFHIQNVGYLLTFILPFRLGDVARAVLIGNVPPVTVPKGISTMVVERVLDLLFVVTLLPFTLAGARVLAPGIRSAARLSGIAALVAIVVLIVAANQRPRARRMVTALLDRVPILNGARWAGHFDELLAGLKSLTRLKDGLVLLSLSVLIWTPIILAYFTGMRAVNLEPSLSMAALVVCVAALSITAPSSPGQVGVFHAGVTFALVQILNQPQAASASFAFLYHALNFAVVIVLGLIGIYSIGGTLGNVVTMAQGLFNRNRESAGI
jgi:uncharacterized protein (TIRG00374 family)